MKFKLLFIALIFSISFHTVSYSSSVNYLGDVSIDAMNAIYESIENIGDEEKISQKVIDLDDTCIFTDYTPIKSVKVNPNDAFRMNKIAITIDDSFSDKYTKEILDVLDKHNCKATFFITYKLFKANPKRILEIIRRGHEIGNHSTTHAPFKNLHSLRKIWEIETLNLWFYTLTNSKFSLFRFPSASYDREAIDMLINFKLYPIAWSIDTRDWELKDTNKIFKNTTKIEVKSGDIILLHNGYGFSKELFDKLLSYYDEKGFSYLKVSDLLYTHNFKVINGVQISDEIVIE